MAAVFILHAVDEDGRPFDATVFESAVYTTDEYGSEQAAENAALADLEFMSANDWPAWELLKVSA